MRSPLAPLSFVLLAGVAASPARAQGQHGAAPPAEQAQALDRLAAAADAADAFDPVVLKAMGGGADTPEQIALGRRLYFDPRLSADDSVACATCHDSTRSFTDRRPVSEGIRDQLGRRNAPTTMNVALLQPLFWDGRARDLAHQAGQPVLNPVEMGMADRPAVVAKLAKIDEYAREFQAAFGRPLNYDDLEKAIAAFERTLVFLDAPFDRAQAGEKGAISEAAARGLVLFEGKARCNTCHPINPTARLLTDFRFHNIGVAAHQRNFEELARQALKSLAEDSSERTLDRLALSTDLSELGRFMITKNQADIGAFRTPQLRNIGITAPYMHDGSMQTLWDVVDHYNKGGEINSYLDGGIEALALTEEEIDDLVAFLFTLTDRRFAPQNDAALAEQKERAAKQRPFRDVDAALRRKLGFEDRAAR
jgi:cytochrome c peroxidase